MRIIGLDVGDRRIGVAVSDERETAAYPLVVLEHTGRKDAVWQVAALVQDQEAAQVVVGLPKTMAGEIGPQAERVMRFVEALRAACPVPVVTWDERLTTVQVERLLVDADTSRRKRRQVVDKLAASLILDSYLSFRKSSRGT